MSVALVQNKVLPAISKPVEYPDSWKGELLKEKNDSARSTLVLHLCDTGLRKIKDKSTAYEIWNSLKDTNLNHSLSNKIYLKEELFGCKISSSKSLDG